MLRTHRVRGIFALHQYSVEHGSLRRITIAVNRQSCSLQQSVHVRYVVLLQRIVQTGHVILEHVFLALFRQCGLTLG